MEGIIHLAGVMPRIGTTTVSLQLILFLKRMGYDAAYVEMNNQNYIWACTSLYADCKKDKLPGKIMYGGIDLYSSERLQELVSGGTHYDYIICDFGNMQSKSFNKAKFLDCGAAILVSGMKPNEILSTELALKDHALDDALYVFSFVPKADQNGILELMQNKAQVTAFMPYSPDPFLAETDGNGEHPTDSCFMSVMDNAMRLITGGAANG